MAKDEPAAKEKQQKPRNKETGANSTCGCSYGSLLGAIALLTLGVYAFVAGFTAQQAGMPYWQSLLFYGVGVIVVMLAKGLKMKGCARCRVHGKSGCGCCGPKKGCGCC